MMEYDYPWQCGFCHEGFETAAALNDHQDTPHLGCKTEAQQ